MTRPRLGGSDRVRSGLVAVRASRCVRDRVDGGCRAVVVGVQRRACHLAVDRGPLLILSASEVPLAPNALAVDVVPHVTLEDAGFRAGQAVVLGASVRPDRGADWLVTLEAASTWEPRPRVHRVGSPALRDRLRTARATTLAEGAGESLLPLLWDAGFDAGGRSPRVVEGANTPARLLRDAAIRGHAASVTRAAGRLAGLGPGLTPSGDDLLAGFAAAWTLVGDALDLDRAARTRVAAALVAGGERGASPLGRAWLAHAARGELLEPMTRFVGALLAAEPLDLAATTRAALAVGSSSGTDWMVGFLLGAAAILETTIPGRLPW